ncbi:MAG TPA: MFS transporter [Roseiflexaceae bacterium]|nr:MFS transporter [Roseiflexaceae bacterium]
MSDQSYSTSGELLSERVRRRGLIALLLDVLCMYTGFFMVVPLISVHYVDGLGWGAAAVGLVLGVRQLAQQGLTLLGGMLADRIGVKWLICAGLLVRVLGFAMLAWADTFVLLFLACLLAAVGGALFESPRAAALAALTRPEQRQRFYSLSGALGGVGMAVGPLVGAALLHVDFSVVALVGAAFFALNLIQTMIMLPDVRVAAQGQRFTHGLGLVRRDRPFLLFTALLMGYWFLWVQLNISLPLLAQRLTGTSDSVGIIYAVNSAMVIGLQYPLVRVVGRRFDDLLLLTVGVGVMSLGIASVALASDLVSLIACVALFSLGGLVVQPTHQTVTAGLSNPSALGSYFGFSSLALALGGGLGNFTGGLLYGVGQQLGEPALPWLVFGAVGLASTAGLARFYLRRRGLGPQPAAAPGQAG